MSVCTHQSSATPTAPPGYSACARDAPGHPRRSPCASPTERRRADCSPRGDHLSCDTRQASADGHSASARRTRRAQRAARRGGDSPPPAPLSPTEQLSGTSQLLSNASPPPPLPPPPSQGGGTGREQRAGPWFPERRVPGGASAPGAGVADVTQEACSSESLPDEACNRAAAIRGGRMAVMRGGSESTGCSAEGNRNRARGGRDAGSGELLIHTALSPHRRIVTAT